MKTRFITLCAFAVASVALFSCNKVETDAISTNENKGDSFEIVANTMDTKTVNDGVHTTWASTDQINVIHAIHGETTYIHDGAFTAKAAGASVGFTGTLAEALSSGNTYDWFAFYPYVSGFSAPDGTKFITIPYTQTQSTKSSSAHLSGQNCPVGGNVKDVAYDTKPVIAMSNLVSVVKIVVTNGTSSDISVNRVLFTAPVQIVGKFNLNLTGATPVLSNNSGNYTATLDITTPGTIAAGATGEYYLSIKPFELGSSQTLTIEVATNKGVKSKTSTALGTAFSFDAGEITTFNFNYDVESTILNTDSESVVVGFESSEGFTASSSYNNTVEKSQGTRAWAVVSGSAINSAAKIAGDQSMLIRDYTANDNPAYVRTYYRLSSVKEVILKAKNTSDGYKLKLSYSTDCGFNWTDATTFNLTSSSAEYKYTFPTNVEDASFKFTMVFPETRVDKKDIIIDDVTFSKTALVPTISVTTNSASNVKTAAGTTATLNGTISLLYGADIADLDEAGFYYKASGAGTYSKVTCSPKPAAEGSYSYNLTGLSTDTEYTYHAYAIYDGGDEIVGTDLTFTPQAALQAVYVPTSTSAVSSSGSIPAEATAAFVNTYSSNKFQLTASNSMTLTLHGYTGKKITAITLSMRSNTSTGAGTFSAVAGTTSLASISSGTNFNAWYDNTSYGTSYRDVHVSLTNSTYTIDDSEDVVITIAATVNSLFCQSFTIEYE